MAKIPIDLAANERIEGPVFNSYFENVNEDENEDGVTERNKEILIAKILIDLANERIEKAFFNLRTRE